jgi:hypothetical protein
MPVSGPAVSRPQTVALNPWPSIRGPQSVAILPGSAPVRDARRGIIPKSVRLIEAHPVCHPYSMDRRASHDLALYLVGTN